MILFIKDKYSDRMTKFITEERIIYVLKTESLDCDF